MSRRSTSGSSEVSVEDTLQSLHGSMESIRLDDVEENDNDRLDVHEEELMSVDDDFGRSDNSSIIKDGKEAEADNGGLHKFLPRSCFVYKYPSSGDADFSLIWLIGNVINGHSSKALFNKYRKLRNAALSADLNEICENLEKHVPELLRPMSSEMAKRHNVNGYNRFDKIGVLIHGLVTILTLQLRFFKNELQTSYANIRKRDVKDDTINLPATGSSPPTKQINISNFLPDEMPDPLMLSFPDFEVSIEGAASPRRAAGGNFEEELIMDVEERDMEPDVSIRSGQSHAASNKDKEKKQQQRRQKRKINIEKEIWRRLEEANPNQIFEAHLPDNLPFDDGKSFDPTSLPPPEDIPEIRVDDQPNQPQCPPMDVSPKRPTVGEPSMPPAPRKEKRARMDDGLALEPLKNVPGKSPRSKRRRTLTFDDATQIPKNPIFRAGVIEVMNDDEKRERLNLLRAPNPKEIPLEGLALIQEFGRQHSTRFGDLTTWYMSSQNIRKEPDITDLSEPDVANAPEEPRLGTNVSDMPSVDNTNISHDMPQPVDNEDPFLGPEDLQPTASNLKPEDGQFNATGARKAFDDVVGPNPSRIDAARTFAMLLRLQAQRRVVMSQEEPYGTIHVQKL